MFENVELEPEQKELLCRLAEGEKNVPVGEREKFSCIAFKGQAVIYHKGLPRGSISAMPVDVDILAGKGLIARQNALFYVTPEGHAYYRWMKQSEAEPVQAVENEVRRFLVSAELKANYSNAIEKWLHAQSLLWTSESQDQYTTVGHLCRESIQYFANALVDQYKPTDIDPNRDHTVNRLRCVLSISADVRGEKEKAFLDALVGYWEGVNGLIQRQEHGAQKQGNQLVWEDARRVVFQTLIVMYEVHRAISRRSAHP